MIGENVGTYRIVAKLGEGGMGAVYVAHHTLLGRKAAIKVLLPALSRQPEVVERFFNEARAVTSMSDPGIVQIFDFGYHTDGSAFIVMELLEGEPLNDRLAQRGRLGMVEALRIGRQVAASLATAHNRGIVHRDLKPENVFMVRDVEVAHGERAKILDFGIAKLSGEGSLSKTNTGALLGTPTYMSPEQCRGAGEVDHRSDLYALGCLLFHLITGAPPFLGEGIGDLIAAHLREPAPAPSSRVAGVPPAVDALVLRCLAKAAGDRHASMAELAGAIDQLLTQQASAEQPTYMLPAATPYPLVRAGASNPFAPAAGASYPFAPAGGASHPPAASYPSPYPLAMAVPMAPPLVTPAPGSSPGTVKLNLPTTLGSSASARTSSTSAPALRRAGRWMGALALVGAAAAAVVMLSIQRGGGEGGEGGATGGVQAAAPSAPSAPSAVSTPAAAAPLPVEPSPPTSPPPTSPPPQAAAVAAAPADAAPIASPAVATAADPAPAAAAAATTEEPAPSRRSSRSRSGRSRAKRDAAAGGCDRSIDTDCDGIPDVR